MAKKRRQTPTWVIEPLGRGHDRTSFHCDEPALNDFLRRLARQQQEKHVGRTFVAVPGPGAETVIGFYTLSAGSIQFEHLPADIQQRLPRYPVPVARLGRSPGRYMILEPSPDLRERQREAVHVLGGELASRFVWLERMPRNFRGVVIANEVVDAMPVHRFVIHRGAVLEVFARWGSGGFEDCDAACLSEGLEAAVKRLRGEGLALSEGYCSEVNLRAGPWVGGLSSALDAGVILVIDYGYPRSEYYLPERLPLFAW